MTCLQSCGQKKTYTLSDVNFLTWLMKDMYLLCDLPEQNHLVPSLLSLNLIGEKGVAQSPGYNGLWFVVDFSGKRLPLSSKRKGVKDRIVPYLPLGLFERLQCMLANHENEFEADPLFEATKRKVQANVGGVTVVEGVF